MENRLDGTITICGKDTGKDKTVSATVHSDNRIGLELQLRHIVQALVGDNWEFVNYQFGNCSGSLFPLPIA